MRTWFYWCSKVSTTISNRQSDSHVDSAYLNHAHHRHLSCYMYKCVLKAHNPRTSIKKFCTHCTPCAIAMFRYLHAAACNQVMMLLLCKCWCTCQGVQVYVPCMAEHGAWTLPWKFVCVCIFVYVCMCMCACVHACMVVCACVCM